MRTEKDHIGTRQLPDDALYGIHALRASENFPVNDRFSENWYKAMGLVKLAVYKTYRRFYGAASKNYPEGPPLQLFSPDIVDVLLEAAGEVAEGQHKEHFIVPATQGGAGTSINMNINEIIANRALQLMGKQPGDYDVIHPIEHANVFQSTNDVVPTALHIAIMEMLDGLEENINLLRSEMETLENRYRKALRLAYTQMQEAVPGSYGRLFATYSDALSRDWWRVSKGFERIKVVNLGGSATGTGMTVPRYMIMEMIKTLQALTQKPVTRGENMADVTANQDSLVEVHAIMKAHAVNLEKMAADIRLLASDLQGNKDLGIPAKQTGSSVMPGKVNPVISEFVISAAHRVYANDQLITALAGQGCLDLNAYLPSMGDAVLQSLHLLLSCDQSLKDHLVRDIKINEEVAVQKLFNSPVITTALLPYTGYRKAEMLSRYMTDKKVDIFEANRQAGILDDKKLRNILSLDKLLREGFSLKDLEDFNDE